MNQRPAVTGRCVWRARDLEDPSLWIERFDRRELAVLDEYARQHSDTALDQLPAIPDEALHARLLSFQQSLENGVGVLRLKGLNADRYSVGQLERLFFALASAIGRPVSQSDQGERIYRVQDQGFNMGHSKARGPNTRRGLSFHTDRSDVISFLCVRPAQSGGVNYVASSGAIHNHIREHHSELLEELYQSFTYKRHNIDHGNDWPYCQQPVFALYEGFFACNILRVLIERAHKEPDIPDLTEAQRAALDLIEETARDPSFHVEFKQEPGDMLFVNNFVVLHSRTEFEDDPEARRLLLRIWLSMPNSRPLDPRFASHYGRTEAGALRGGIYPPGERPW